mmetsp:Transcript_12182/g.28933  ORF Transcript_12182/g.28933 Transcript_12182/m.28933 type:complete len:324 (-) Transcript_12182:92-1063(-)
MLATLPRLGFCKLCPSKRSKLISACVLTRPVRRTGECGRGNGRCLSTYYDSQSGLHLPVHNETEITLFLDVRGGHEDNGSDSKLPFVPHQLNKDRVEADEVSDKLERLLQQGIHGVILPAIKFPRDIRNLQTLSAISPPGFVFLTGSSSGTDDSNNVDNGLLQAKELSSSDTNFSKILRYHSGDEFQKKLQRSVGMGLHTTLSVTEDIYTGDVCDVEPITLANNVAAMIDTNGGCDYIWISSEQTKENNMAIGETMVQVCEELVYLDVAGATIKSRLLVDFLNEDMLEDVMFAGVNKYAIRNEDQAEMVESTAKEQGKTLLQS